MVLHRLVLPMRTSLRSAHGTELDREVILIEVRPDDGPSGWGECSALRRPSYTSEYIGGAWAVLAEFLVPAFLEERPSGVVGHPMAAAALADARADAALRRLGRPLVESVAARSGPSRRSVERTAVVGRGSTELVLAQVDRRVGEGVAAVKLKVTGDPTDLGNVEAVRDRYPDLPVAVDANGTLDHRGLGRLDDLGLLYIEQPAPADDLLLSARWARTCRTPIALDEAIDGPGAVGTAAAIGAGTIVNVKPARLGGIDAAVETMRVAAEQGLAMFVGGMLETAVGRAAALAVAASRRCTLPTDLGPSASYFESDVSAEPIRVDEAGRVIVPEGPGSGIDVDPARIEDLRVDRIELR